MEIGLLILKGRANGTKRTMIRICYNLINYWFAEFNLLLCYYYERICIFLFIYIIVLNFFLFDWNFVHSALLHCKNFYTIQSVTLSRIIVTS